MEMKKVIDYLRRVLDGIEKQDMNKNVTGFKVCIYDNGIHCVITSEKKGKEKK